MTSVSMATMRRIMAEAGRNRAPKVARRQQWKPEQVPQRSVAPQRRPAIGFIRPHDSEGDGAIGGGNGGRDRPEFSPKTDGLRWQRW